jgi:hypothetical protein
VEVRLRIRTDVHVALRHFPVPLAHRSQDCMPGRASSQTYALPRGTRDGT